MRILTNLVSAAVVTAVGAAMVISVASIAPASAAPTANQELAASAGEISRGQAKQVVKEYLSQSGHSNYRVGTVRRSSDSWIVKVKTRQGLHVGTYTVDLLTGELSTS